MKIQNKEQCRRTTFKMSVTSKGITVCSSHLNWPAAVVILGTMAALVVVLR